MLTKQQTKARDAARAAVNVVRGETDLARRIDPVKWKRRTFAVIENATVRARALHDTNGEQEAAQIQARVEALDDLVIHDPEVRVRITESLMALAIRLAQMNSLTANVRKYT